MEDPRLILTLKSITQRASDAFKLPHNRDRYMPPPANVAASDTWSRETTPATNVRHDERADFSHKIQLAFNDGHEIGWWFGGSRSCDILLGRGHISNRHFYITFDNQERLVLEAKSKTHTMTVSYNGRAEEQDRKYNFKWILFPWARRIKVTIDRDPTEDLDKQHDELQFWIELAKHDTCQGEYQRNVRAFLEKCQNEEKSWDEEFQDAKAFNYLNMDSHDSTAIATAVATPLPRGAEQDPIYLPVEELGRGQFGKVYKVIDVSTEDEYAGKFFYRGEWDREVEIIKKVSHEHIVKFIYFTDKVGPLLVMDYLPHGNLLHQQQLKRIDEREFILLLRQILLALKYLHGLHPNPIVHRDLKPANILFHSREPFYIKVSDFGFATDASDFKTDCGTPAYRAPETFEGSSYTTAADMWSLGILLFECAYNRPPKPRGQGHWHDRFLSSIDDLKSETTPLIQFLSDNMVKRVPKERLSAADCLDIVPDLVREMFLARRSLVTTLSVSDDETEAMMPTEMPHVIGDASSNREQLQKSNLEEAETRTDYPTFIHGQQLSTQIWDRPTDDLPPIARATPEEEEAHAVERLPSAPISATREVRRRQLKRPHDEIPSMRSTSIQQRKASRTQFSPLTEDRPGYIQMTVRGKIVSMRRSDFWLNATQILVLANKSPGQIKATLDIMRKHTTVKAEKATRWTRHPTSWVPYEHGRFLCDALGLTDALSQLLEFGIASPNAQQCQKMLNYFDSPFIYVATSSNGVSIRKGDFWVNANHILKVAGLGRAAVTKIRDSGIPYDIVTGHAKFSGTYIELLQGLKLCDAHGLAPLKASLTLQTTSSHGLDGDHQSRNSAQRPEVVNAQHREASYRGQDDQERRDEGEVTERVGAYEVEEEGYEEEEAYENEEEAYKPSDRNDTDLHVTATVLEASDSLHTEHASRSSCSAKGNFSSGSIISQSSFSGFESNCVTFPTGALGIPYDSSWMEDRIR